MGTIEHFAIYASDIEVARAFYMDVLGMRIAIDNSKAPTPGYFLRGERGSALEIISRPEGISGVNQRYVCHIAFLVDDYHKARTDLESRGISFETETVVYNDEIRTAFFPDPEGNRCQILWRKTPLGI